MRRRDRSRAATPAKAMGMTPYTGAPTSVVRFWAPAKVGETMPEGGTE